MTTEENKQWLQSALYGYTEARFRERFKHIVLTDTGIMKMGVCLGFLAANESLIDNFFKNLEWMDRTDVIQVPFGERTRAVPNKITKMSDDGTLFGFSFMQMIYVPEKTERSEVFGYWGDNYAYGMNGGLIFHGLGNNNFSVTLGSNIGWQIHT